MDRTLMEMELDVLLYEVQEYFKDIEKSSTTLTAAFANTSIKKFNRRRNRFADSMAEDLGAEVRPGDSFVTKAFKIAVVAEQKGFEMTAWKDVLPKLKSIANEAERQNAGEWGTARIARQVLQ